VPRPERFPDKQFRAERMPPISGRVELFKDILAGNALVQGSFPTSRVMMRCWHGIPPTRWRRAHRTCLDRLRRTGYAIADDAATPALPWWIHPQYSDALGNRITILQRSPSP
jgi:hypothetical protein